MGSRRVVAGLRTVAGATAKIGLCWAGPASVALLGLAIASSQAPAMSTRPRSHPRVKVIVPAHNEESVLGDCLAAIQRFSRGSWRPSVLVVADNCSDRTAELAGKWGAHPLVRVDPARPGKGEALAWALDQPGVLDDADVFFFLDADTLPEPDALEAALARLEQGGDVVQVALISRGARRDDRSAVNWWATTLMGRVRDRGLNVLGLPARLHGAGMAIRAEVLRQTGWPTGGISEDFFATEVFIDAGFRLLFTDGAIVWARAVETDAAMRTQQLRWESGKLLSVARLPHYLWRALERRSLGYVSLAFHVGTPQTTLHAAMLAASTALALVAGAPGRRTVLLSASSFAALTVYLAEGLRLMGDREMAQRAVLAGPRFVWWKLGVLREASRRFRNLEWERTPREGMAG